MALVVHRTTLELLTSVHTPDYDPVDWLINPELPDCPPIYWKVVGDVLEEMTAEEKAEVDAAAAKLARLNKASADWERLVAAALRLIASEAIRGVPEELVPMGG